MTRTAFTLFEVLVAVVFLAAISGSLVAFVWRTVEARERIVRVAGNVSDVSMLFERLETDLFTCLAGEGESGLTGTPDSVVVRSRGVSLETPAGAPADLQGAEYRVAGDRIEARRWDGEAATGGFEVMASGVARLRFRYHDGRGWRNSFNSSTAAALPVAIEIAVWLGAQPSERDPVEESDAEPERWPAPDRLRIIAVPDGPVTGARALP